MLSVDIWTVKWTDPIDGKISRDIFHVYEDQTVMEAMVEHFENEGYALPDDDQIVIKRHATIEGDELCAKEGESD